MAIASISSSPRCGKMSASSRPMPNFAYRGVQAVFAAMCQSLATVSKLFLTTGLCGHAPGAGSRPSVRVLRAASLRSLACASSTSSHLPKASVLRLPRKSVVQPPELRARRCDQQVEAISSDSLYRLCLGSALFTPNAARGTDGILFLALAAIPSKVPSGVLRRARYHAHSGRELSEISGHLRVLQRAYG